MIALVEREHHLSILLTQRAKHLKHHPGQISFLGGKVEKQDTDPIDTAIRETQEEIGVILPRSDILGTLAPLSTLSGYEITPIIGFVDANYHATLDNNEVDLLFELPLGRIITAEGLICQKFTVKGYQISLCAVHPNNHLIWGATAQILNALVRQITLPK